ncbi:glycoprotein-N-acetylgalactosamine 3-beta-galactosyltransferase 1 [Strongylocentrotus purpuratus]|uniref:N-acetylgalactosaminide beta-1,3-galactosyltransferase n=2 Tax=Strongylocentrotus purpuratus TaxID=7668 RepID=A0A7M7G041_STRPU|nr:glycoprotein-N-acetylgalactosamine 3-beta-galactosyltransferase 1 [Strongylocentrotus purpuratus]
MGFSQLRVFLAFISGAIFMLFTLTMINQQMFVFQRHPHSTLTARNQAVIQKNAVPLSLHALKAAPRTTVTDSESNGIAEKKLSDVTQRTRLRKVRLLCWVLTSPKTLKTKATMVARTWAKKCSQTLFMSSQKSTSFPGNVIGLEVAEGRNALWNKTRMSLEYIYTQHFNDADWFFKADDDTYVVVENLMAFLSRQDPSEPVFFGFSFNKTLPYFKVESRQMDYMSGGAGYAMSREALRRFVEVGLQDRTGQCPDSHLDWPEDLCLGMCMESLGVRSKDHRDRYGRFRFLPIYLHYFLDDGMSPLTWLHEYSKYNITRGQDCCSESLISIHYVNPGDMLVYDFLIHNVKVGLLDG